MTHAEQILSAVRSLVVLNKHGEFTREDIRRKTNVSREEWVASYSPIFQGMRTDQPGGAPDVGPKYKNVFRRVRHGYTR